MRIFRHIITCLLLLLVTLTGAAQESKRPLCSRGRHPLRVAQSDRRAGLLTSQRRAVYKGEKRQLVFLVAFSDLTFQDPDPATLWGKVFNEKDFEEEPFRGSVRDYFYEQSFETFDLQFDLYYIRMDKEHKEYRSGDIDYYDDTRSGLLLTEILNQKKDEIADWSVYDWNGDGYVNQVFILFAGMGQNDTKDPTTIWPHQATLSSHAEKPYYREWGHPYVVSSGDKEYKVDSYAIFAELSSAGDYGSFGTLVHEYGHCLGLPDFYYGGSTSVVGEWDIMDNGNYNSGGFCPANYSAHERMVLGWMDIPELTEKTTVTDMQSLSNGKPEAYLIRNDGCSDEYYIVENRQKSGWDSSLPGSGIVVFHVDYDAEIWRTGVPNNDSHKRYAIIPANNRLASKYGWAYPYDGNNALTNTSSPAATLLNANSDETYLMNKPLTQMAVSNGLASFHFMDDGTAIEQPTSASSDAPQVIYRMGPVTFLRYPDGTVRKQIK